jgi:hypothetical protein
MMVRSVPTVVALMLWANTALAAPPQFSSGGFTFNVAYGISFWNINKDLLAKQTTQAFADIVATDFESFHSVNLRLAYTILGHVSVGIDFLATGWQIDNTGRGGAGFLVGSLTWHPLELVFLKKERRPIPLDVGILLGGGYGLAGERLGMDGPVFQLALMADYFFVKYFALGATFRTNFLLFNKLYTNFNDRVYRDLPQGSGGQQFQLALTLTFRAGE